MSLDEYLKISKMKYFLPYLLVIKKSMKSYSNVYQPERNSEKHCYLYPLEALTRTEFLSLLFATMYISNLPARSNLQAPLLWKPIETLYRRNYRTCSIIITSLNYTCIAGTCCKVLVIVNKRTLEPCGSCTWCGNLNKPEAPPLA